MDSKFEDVFSARYLKYLSELTQEYTEEVESDIELKKDIEEEIKINWVNNSVQYNKLLSNYAKNNESNLELKQKQKWVFFIASISILVFTTVGSGILIFVTLFGDNDVVSKLLQVVPLLLTFLTPLLTIPNIIAKYLFNIKEDKNMIKVIEQIIMHDDNSLNKDFK